MKKFLFATLVLLMVTATTFAQRPWKSKTVFTGTDKRAWFSDGTQMLQFPQYQLDSTSTTDSAYHVVDTIKIAANEAGVLKVTVIGYNDSLGSAVTGVQYVRYKKVAGTLTLGTPQDALTKETDASLGAFTSTWDITAGSNQVLIRVKGRLTYTIRWTSTVEKIAKYKS